MTKPFQRLRRFLAELKRRNVYQVAATYAVVGFVVIQAANLIFPALNIPSWAYSLVVVLTLLGFPLALVVAWAFEVTPEGVRRTMDAEPARDTQGQPEGGGVRTGYKVLVGLGLVAAAAAGGWYLTGGGGTSISDRSVAVLPFETLGDTAQTTFTEGLHNDLLTRLQRISELTVIARPSVMRYEDTDKPLEQVAEELNARWIVTAAVQTAGNQVQVNPRLIDPRSGTERWSDSYRRERSADEVFSLQQEITQRIADALETELASGERERVGERPTGDLDAYRLYAQGRRRFAQRSLACPSCVEEAVKLFRRAIEQDSSFALAWAGLADAAAFYPSEALDSTTAPSVEQKFAARSAVELGPNLAEARASMGHFHLRNMSAPAAREELRRAIELKPSSWEAHHWLGELYLKTGYPQQALEHLELAIELNPRHARARHLLYDAYLVTGQPEKSLQEARRQQRMGLEETNAVAGEVRALIVMDSLRQAHKLAEKKVAELTIEEFWGRGFRGHLAQILARQGDTARAREYLKELIDADASPARIARVYRALGQPNEALEAYQRMDKQAWGYVGPAIEFRYGTQQGLAPISDDPRYRKLLEEANRAWGLNPDGSFPSEGESDG